MEYDVIVAGSSLAAAAAASAIGRRRLTTALIEEPEPTSASPVADFGWYSAWWPGTEPALDRLAQTGIDALEAAHRASGGAFAFGGRGQLLVTEREDVAELLRHAAGRHAADGGGPLREHAGPEWYLPGAGDGVRGVPGGLDLLEGGALRAVFPFLGKRVRLGVHVRRAGVVDRGALRRWLLAGFREAGGRHFPETIIGIEADGSRGWRVRFADGRVSTAGALVLAGPRARRYGRLLGVDLPWAEWLRVTAVLQNGKSVLAPGFPMVVAPDFAPTVGGGPVSELAEETAVGVPSVSAAGGEALRIEGAAPAGTRPEQVMALGEGLLQRLTGMLPGLASRRGPPGSLSIAGSRASVLQDLRPVAGPSARPGVYLFTGFGPVVSHMMALAETLSETVQHATGRSARS